MLVYHATEKRNLNSIEKEGLKRFFGEIYFADSIKIAKKWIEILKEDSFYPNRKWIILEINLNRTDLIFDKSIENISQFIYKKKDISFHQIKQIQTNPLQEGICVKRNKKLAGITSFTGRKRGGK